MPSFAQKIKEFFLVCPENKCRPGILFSSFLFWLSLILLALHVLPIFFFTFFQNDPLFGDITRTSIVALTNQERTGLGLNELTVNAQLETAARKKANDMFANGYFAHESPKGVAPWYWFNEAGYDYEYAGENLAIGFLEPEEVYSGWVHSFTHHQNLLNPNFKEIGVAVVGGNFNGNYTTIVVQLFGSSKPKGAIAIQGIPKINPPIAKKPQTLPQNPSSTPVALAEKTPTTAVPLVNGQTNEKAEPSPSKAAAPLVAGREYIVFDDSALAAQGNTVLQKPSLKMRLYSFLIFQYNDILKMVTFWILLAVCALLLISMSFAPEVREPNIMFKSVFFLIVLIAFAVTDKKTLIELIPHSFSIN